MGSGTARSWKDLITAIYGAVGLDPRIDYVDMPLILRENYQYYTQADMNKLRLAGYPGQSTPLESAVQTYVTDYLALTDRYR